VRGEVAGAKDTAQLAQGLVPQVQAVRVPLPFHHFERDVVVSGGTLVQLFCQVVCQSFGLSLGEQTV
jgi:hypothetical protein